jgi:Transposase DDE domain
MARSTPTRRRGKPARSLLTNKQSFAAFRDWFLPGDTPFASLTLHGNTRWKPSALVWLALCWAWSDARNLTDAFTQAADCCQRLFGAAALSTYQGFLGALLSWTPSLLPLLRGVLQRSMQLLGGKFWRVDGWVPIAFDGSRSTAPRTQANELALCAPRYGRGKTAKYRKKKSKGLRRRNNRKAKPQQPKPQAWITLLWHMGLRLPWDWRLGPSNASERAHVMEMLESAAFPENTLFCGDAGFVGYPLWSAISAAGGDFLVRVGANVSLLHEEIEYQPQKGKKKDFPVLCWPKKAQQAKQEPLELRLLQVRLGKTTMWLLTSVRERERLSAKAAVRFYRLRWGVEVEFRGLKQTLERAKLRSRNDRRLLVELDWSILAMAVAELAALKEQLARRAARSAGQGKKADPAKRSLAKTMRALRHCLANLDEVPAPGQDLASRLGEAVTDSYQRRKSKRARYRPPNPDKKPLGDPQVHPLDQEEKEKLQQWRAKQAG